MELASKIREAINANDDSIIRSVYLEAFGKSIKKDCGNCYSQAIEKLIRFLKQNKPMGAYQFKKEHKGKQVVFKVGGARVLINEANLTDEHAELLINNSRGHLIELVGEVKQVKKNQSVKESSEPTLSTSTEVLTDGSELVEKSSESELNLSESQPLTVKKKRGRPKNLG